MNSIEMYGIITICILIYLFFEALFYFVFYFTYTQYTLKNTKYFTMILFWPLTLFLYILRCIIQFIIWFTAFFITGIILCVKKIISEIIKLFRNIKYIK